MAKESSNMQWKLAKKVARASALAPFVSDWEPLCDGRALGATETHYCRNHLDPVNSVPTEQNSRFQFALSGR